MAEQYKCYLQFSFKTLIVNLVQGTVDDAPDIQARIIIEKFLSV